MGGWSRVILGGEEFLLKGDQGVFFIHSMGNRDYRMGKARERLSMLLGLSRIVKVRQVHSSIILDAEGVRGSEEGDGLFLSQQAVKVGIAVLTADCLPLLFVAPRHLLLLHVGWRGLRSGIIQKGLRKLRLLYSDIRDIRIWFGPSIKQCCYQVGLEMVRELEGGLPQHVVEAGVAERDGKVFFSLDVAVARLLELEGVERHPEKCGLCTCCSGLFPSYRREGNGASRMISLAWRAYDHP